MKYKNDLTQEYLKCILNYDSETGIFSWLTTRHNRVKVGQIAGHKNKLNYTVIRTNNKLYFAHRLAYLYMKGEWPRKGIDHIDGNGSNNEWINLREATQSQNAINSGLYNTNTSGYKGVIWNKANKNWRSRITVNDNRIDLGYFSTKEEAFKVRKAAELKYFGDYAR